MIKINLVKGLQAPSGVRVEAGAKSALGGISSISIDPSLLVLFLRKLGLPVLVVYLGSSVLDGMRAEQLARLQVKVDQVSEANRKLQAEMVRIKKLEEVQARMEEDEKSIRLKLSVMSQLLDDRVILPKMLLGITSALPATVWLADLKHTPEELSLRGFALELSQVSELIKTLSEFSQFKQVELKNTRQVQDPVTRRTLESFDIVAVLK
jgi:Tfp pilus assembly protein PilN